MSTAGHRRRITGAEHAIASALATISHAQTRALLAVGDNPTRVEAINHATEHAMAAMLGMGRATRPGWLVA